MNWVQLEKKLFEIKSSFQKIEVYQTKDVGKTLFLDGVEQFSDLDEHIYHEAMANIPLSIHKNPNNILIIGGGDGGVARECLKNKLVQKIDLCEIDVEVVNVCKDFFPQTSESLKDSRVNLIIGDAKDYIDLTKNFYDIIIVDSTDPISNAIPLFGESFYKNLNNILNDNGLIVSQIQTVAIDPISSSNFFNFLYNIFKHIDCFDIKYCRPLKEQHLLFCVLSQVEIAIPKKYLENFKLNHPDYKKVKKFLDKMSWIKN